MPKAPRACAGGDYICGALIYGTARYCDEHQPKAWRGPRTRSSTITSTAAWKALRRSVLQRDNYQCQIRGPHCTNYADQVDHITNVAAGGAPFDPDNAQSACSACNTRKASAEGAAARRSRQPQKPLHPGLLR